VTSKQTHCELTKSATAVVSAKFMKKKVVNVQQLWLDGKRHPKIGTLTLLPSESGSVYPIIPSTKKMREWQQEDPWNKQDVSAQEFWRWFEATERARDMRDLVLYGGDYAELADLAPTMRRSQMQAQLMGSHSAMYQRLLASIILPETSSIGGSPGIPIVGVAAPSSLLQIPAIGIRKRTIFELGALGLLRDSDGKGNWSSIEDEVALADCDSKTCEEIRDLVKELKKEETILNARVFALRKKIAAEGGT